MDTPGIGDTEELNVKLKGYLPKAVSFIFVINVGNAGGMQLDRVIHESKSPYIYIN